MAVHLADVILRRTNLGSGSHPGALAVVETAQRMQQLLGWSDARRREEIALTEQALLQHHASVPGGVAASSLG